MSRTALRFNVSITAESAMDWDKNGAVFRVETHNNDTGSSLPTQPNAELLNSYETVLGDIDLPQIHDSYAVQASAVQAKWAQYREAFLRSSEQGRVDSLAVLIQNEENPSGGQARGQTKR